MTTNYSSQHQSSNTSSINIPHYYEINKNIGEGINYDLDNLTGYTGYIPNLHSVAEAYDKNEKLKDVFKSDNLF